jgi:hypothetical protein
MTFPASSTQVPTTNLDSGADDPSLARADIYQAVTLLNEIIAGRDAALGAATLDSGGKIASSRLPQNIVWNGGGNQFIAPTTGVVEIQSVLRLSPLTKAAIQSVSTATIGQGSLAYCSNITTTTSGIVYWDGNNWKTITAGGNL